MMFFLVWNTVDWLRLSSLSRAVEPSCQSVLWRRFSKQHRKKCMNGNPTQVAVTNGFIACLQYSNRKGDPSWRCLTKVIPQIRMFRGSKAQTPRVAQV